MKTLTAEEVAARHNASLADKSPAAGHNSQKHVGDQLKSIIERVERLAEEKKVIADDIRDVFAEAKGNGFDTKVLRAIIRERAQDANEVAEFETIKDTYKNALGMLN